MLFWLATSAFIEDPARPVDHTVSKQLHVSSPAIWLTPTLSNDTVSHVLFQIPTDEKAWTPCIGQVNHESLHETARFRRPSHVRHRSPSLLRSAARCFQLPATLCSRRSRIPLPKPGISTCRFCIGTDCPSFATCLAHLPLASTVTSGRQASCRM